MGWDLVLPALLVNPADWDPEFVRQFLRSKEPAFFVSIARRLDLFPHGLADRIQEHFAKDGILGTHFWLSPWTLEGHHAKKTVLVRQLADAHRIVNPGAWALSPLSRFPLKWP